MSKITLCLNLFCPNKALLIPSQLTFKDETFLLRTYLKDTAPNNTMLTRLYPNNYPQHRGIAHQQQPNKTKIKSTLSPHPITTLIRRTQMLNKRRLIRGNGPRCNDLPTREVSAQSRRANPMRKALNRILCSGQAQHQSNIRIMMEHFRGMPRLSCIKQVLTSPFYTPRPEL